MMNNPHHETYFGVSIPSQTIAGSDINGSEIAFPGVGGDDLVFFVVRAGTVGAAVPTTTLSIRIQGKKAGTSTWEDLLDTAGNVLKMSEADAFKAGTSFQTRNVCIGTIPMNSFKPYAADGSRFSALRPVAIDAGTAGIAAAVMYGWFNLRHRPSGEADYLFDKVRHTSSV